MTKYHATMDSVGNWDGDENDVVQCWNTYVAPALQSLYDRQADETGNDNGITDSIHSLAWEEFCGTDGAETWDELGRRVAQFVNQC